MISSGFWKSLSYRAHSCARLKTSKHPTAGDYPHPQNCCSDTSATNYYLTCTQLRHVKQGNTTTRVSTQKEEQRRTWLPSCIQRGLTSPHTAPHLTSTRRLRRPFCLSNSTRISSFIIPAAPPTTPRRPPPPATTRANELVSGCASIIRCIRRRLGATLLPFSTFSMHLMETRRGMDGCHKKKKSPRVARFKIAPFAKYY